MYRQLDLTSQQSGNTYKTQKADIALDKLSVKEYEDPFMR